MQKNRENKVKQKGFLKHFICKKEEKKIPYRIWSSIHVFMVILFALFKGDTEIFESCVNMSIQHHDAICINGTCVFMCE